MKITVALLLAAALLAQDKPATPPVAPPAPKAPAPVPDAMAADYFEAVAAQAEATVARIIQENAIKDYCAKQGGLVPNKERNEQGHQVIMCRPGKQEK